MRLHDRIYWCSRCEMSYNDPCTNASLLAWLNDHAKLVCGLIRDRLRRRMN